jgi:hypothetical protein
MLLEIVVGIPKERANFREPSSVAGASPKKRRKRSDPPLIPTLSLPQKSSGHLQGVAKISVPVVVLVFCSLIYLVFLFWYGGRRRPMSPAEVEALLKRVQRDAEAAGVPLAPDLLSSLRQIAKDDDGREFVMVNLIRYRTKAVYPPGWDYGDDPHAADARYNRAVVPLLLKRACVPIFLGRSAGRFLDPEGAEPWDCVALVRYRSRRDFLGLCADLAQNRADIHKWAAIETTQIFPVGVRFSLSVVRLIVGGALALVVLLVFLWRS